MSSSKKIHKAEDSGVYYFLGNITSHALHLLPLHKKLRGTVVVLSERAKKNIENEFGLPVIRLQDSPDTALELTGKHKPTFDFLERNANQIVFYEVFKYLDRSLVPKKPVTFFLTHGNMLKNYMNDSSERSNHIKDYDYVAGIGPYLKKKFIKESNIPKEKILDVGVARTDSILNKELQKKLKVKTINKLESCGLKKGQNIVSYLPTYWGDSSVYNTGLKILANVNKDHFLIVRPHPQTKQVIMMAYKLLTLVKSNVLLADHGNTLDISLEDIYATSDVIVGDVSSVMLEAVLLRKPLIFAYGSGSHRQDPSAYEAISEIVEYSNELDGSSAKDVSSYISKSILKGLDEKMWDKIARRTFFLCKGRCVDEIARLVKSLPKK